MATPRVESTHRNSEGEQLSIQRSAAPEFDGQPLLVIHDDPPSRAIAPTLFDAGTRAWLREQIDRLDREDTDGA